ncbi:hypothetical protein CXB51_027553 [Gossypium anomalum]|uniref:K Homology domain-containing protein n=1 Tax=Gossypium anomalum TaxID=47600 RepID=A0A8J5XZ66_9ROSI|nr:hypothetical protein CXB51_027553 [Gossypium anomalum]
MAGESYEDRNAIETPEDLAVPLQPEETKMQGAGGDGEKKWPGWPGENVFRMLVPAQKVGTIIGPKGEFIRNISDESRARIKILDGPPTTSERAVMVSAKEEPDAPIPPSMDGLLRIHRRILGLDGDYDHTTAGANGRVITRLLVADTQAGSLIGRQGSTIKYIQDASNCNIRVLGGEHLPVFSLKDDSVVEIEGGPTCVHAAIELIAGHLRKFLVHRSIIGVFEMQHYTMLPELGPEVYSHECLFILLGDISLPMQNVSTNQNMVVPQSQHHLHGSPIADSEALLGSKPKYMYPESQFDDCYEPHELPLHDKNSYQGPALYGKHGSMGGHASNVQAKQSAVTKIIQHMQIPLSYANAVIGTSGYMRRASGAAIAIQETRDVPGDMTVEISGSASEVQAAEQLIRNFIAEAASGMQSLPGGSISEEYSPYPVHAPLYASSDANGHVSHATVIDHGSIYGTGYGY